MRRNDQVEGLEAEGGEGSKSAADTHHDKEADVVGGRVSAAVQRERAEVADDERADYVDEGMPMGKSTLTSKEESRTPGGPAATLGMCLGQKAAARWFAGG
jgi:hypothetical protein